MPREKEGKGVKKPRPPEGKFRGSDLIFSTFFSFGGLSGDLAEGQFWGAGGSVLGSSRGRPGSWLRVPKLVLGAGLAVLGAGLAGIWLGVGFWLGSGGLGQNWCFGSELVFWLGSGVLGQNRQK